MRILATVVLSSMALLAAPLALADDAKPQAPTPVTNTATSDPLICHTFVHEGRIIRQRECHTQKEWNNIQFHEQQEIRDMQTRALTSN